jgi:tetratricopeptide (TPR) repeat protein
LEKAIEIKRRAQRCIQNGDLDGALGEYEKLVGAPDSDPYNYVLLADLLYKKGDQGGASDRYLSAVTAYQGASLYKNAIAVCKKMVRLSLSPARVLESLATLHALDGLAGEASLYYVQFAEHLVRAQEPTQAAEALRKAFDVSQENIRVLEQLSEAWLLAGDNTKAAQAMLEAAGHYRNTGAAMEAKRCEERARALDSGAQLQAHVAAAPPSNGPTSAQLPEPGRLNLDATPAAAAPVAEVQVERATDLDDGRFTPPPAVDVTPIENAAAESAPVEATPVEAPSTASTSAGPYRLGPLPLGEASPEPMATEAPRLVSPGFEAPLEASEEESNGVPVYEISEEAEPTAAPTAPAWDAPAANEDESPGVYEIPAEDEAAPEPAAEVPAHAEHDAKPSDGVYEIADDDEPVSAPTAIAEPEPAVAEVATPVFALPETEPEPEPVASEAAASAPVASEPEAASNPALSEVEELLVRAQTQFRAGDRDEASQTLAQAARACEANGRVEHAASIYRSLGKGPHATSEMLEMWLANCVRRNDAKEAGQVACELGDRSLNGGDSEMAKRWFKRAVAFDPDHELALRRLHRLEQASASSASIPAPVAAESAPEAPSEGRVEVAIGRAQAVSFDLAGLLAEFQRGVEAQLAGDAQSHYDLGMTYREMGLLDQAMSSFRCAEQDPAFAGRALEMVGRCLSEQGRLAEAEAEFRQALEAKGVTPENDGELRYHLGLALAGQGRHADALLELERAQSLLPGFEDVDQHVADLRSMLGRAA